ncbi:hypothetical protein V5O48_012855 [Marasmius crinis-equi]|uniref:Uncharacterized protein n=1 Tax=Marasmius crinis-equi TaxID=585013 RepID=A0ABR3F1P6_9AGAR
MEPVYHSAALPPPASIPHSQPALPPPSQPQVIQLFQQPPGMYPHGSVVYLIGYPPGGPPGQVVQMAQAPAPTTSNPQPPPPVMTAGHHSSPLSRRGSGALPPPQPQSHSQSSGQPVQWRQTFPQQIQGGSGSHTPIHTHQPHHTHTLPLPVSTPSSGMSSHHGHQQPHPERQHLLPQPHQQQTQLTGYQQVRFPSGKPIPPSSTSPKPAVINTHPNPSSSSSSHGHPPPFTHPNSNSSHHQPPPGSLTHSFQRILNNAYHELLAVVEMKEKERSDKHDRAEKERSRGEKEMFERVPEERDRMRPRPPGLPSPGSE